VVQVAPHLITGWTGRLRGQDLASWAHRSAGPKHTFPCEAEKRSVSANKISEQAHNTPSKPPPPPWRGRVPPSPEAAPATAATHVRARAARATTARKMGTSINHDVDSSGPARGGGRAKRSREQQHPQQTLRFVPDAHGAPREAMTTTGQPQAHQPHRQHESDLGDVGVEEGEEDSREEAEEEAVEAEDELAEEEKQEEEDEEEEEEGAVEDEEEEEEEVVEEKEKEETEEVEDDGNVSGVTAIGVAVPVKRRPCSSHFKGVSWHKSSGKWEARRQGKFLGYHATEEAAAQAYDKYVNAGIAPVRRRDTSSTSQFKGVTWDKSCCKWRAICKGKSLGYHATEEAAAQAHDSYAKVGRCKLTPSNPVLKAVRGAALQSLPKHCQSALPRWSDA